MTLLNIIKNYTIEIIIICTIVIGATSSILITLYEIQITNIKSKYDADMANMRNDYQDKIKKLTSRNCSSEVVKIQNDYEKRLKELQSKLAEEKLTPTDCSSRISEIKDDYEHKINVLQSKLAEKNGESTLNSEEILLTITDCKGYITQVKPNSNGMKMKLGGGLVMIFWKDIEKSVFTCANRKFDSGKEAHEFMSENPVEIYFKDGNTKKLAFNYFNHKGGASEFIGKTDFDSEYKIKVTNIKEITVK